MMSNFIIITIIITITIIILTIILLFSLSGLSKNKHICPPESKGATACTREYNPVCGWNNDNVKCIKYPCASSYSNPCMACSNKDVEYYTLGKCPTTL